MRVGCYECHGRDAQSGGPPLGPDSIVRRVHRQSSFAPRYDLPPYTVKVLSDEDLAEIYAFVQSVPQPPKVDSIPLLK